MNIYIYIYIYMRVMQNVLNIKKISGTLLPLG